MRILLLSVFCLCPLTAWSGPVEDRLIAENPCRGVPVADKTKDLRIDQFSADLKSNSVSLTLRGFIRCHNGSGAFIKVSASANVEADADVDLASCNVTRADVRLNNIDNLPSVARDYLNTEVSDNLRKKLKKMCLDLRN